MCGGGGLIGGGLGLLMGGLPGLFIGAGLGSMFDKKSAGSATASVATQPAQNALAVKKRKERQAAKDAAASIAVSRRNTAAAVGQVSSKGGTLLGSTGLGIQDSALNLGKQKLGA